jgi:hypothetical protein
MRLIVPPSFVGKLMVLCFAIGVVAGLWIAYLSDAM